MKSFDTVILGSGYFSLGYALSSDNVLIIERTQLSDPNFGGTLSGFGFNISSAWTNETKSLHSYYLDNKIVSEFRLNSSVSEVGLCAYIEKRNVNILLGTECIDIKKRNDGYELTLINNGGYDRLFCKMLIDTRCSDEKKYLNVLCRGNAGSLASEVQGKFKLSVAGAFETKEYVAEFAFNDALNVNLAKTEALRYLEKHFAECGDNIVQCAYVMHASTLLPAFDDCGILKVRELSIGDPFAAFDAGVRLASEGAI